jgi:integrase
MKRRGHGEGSVYKRSDGRWCGVVELNRKSGKRNRKSVYGSTQSEVVKKIAALRAQLDGGMPAPNDQLTVESLLALWLHQEEGKKMSPNTIDQYQWVIGKHLVPDLGHLKVTALAPKDVTAFLSRKGKDGYSKSSCVRFKSVLGQALRFAEIEGWVQRNVARLSDVPRIEVPEGKSLTELEARHLLEAVKGDALEGVVVAMLTLGLRLGEVSGLRWEDIDFENKTLRVHQTVKREPGGLRIGGTKTPRSRRTLAIPGITGEALMRRKIFQNADRLAAGESWRDIGLVFTTSVGTPLDPKNLRRHFNKVTKDAGLGHWTPTDLRHSTVSLLSAAGVPLECIADIAGHVGTRMTGGIYRHVLAPVIDHAAEPMDQFFSTTG